MDLFGKGSNVILTTNLDSSKLKISVCHKYDSHTTEQKSLDMVKINIVEKGESASSQQLLLYPLFFKTSS